MSLILDWLESMHVDLKITDKCSRHRNLCSTCTKCLDACKYEALSLNQQLIEIDSNRCTSCSDCIIACPLSAIEGVVATREFEKGSLIYNDAYTPTEKELLIYKNRGLNSIRIEELPLNQQWERVRNEVNRLLIQLGQRPIEVVKRGNDKKLSRRAFFTSVQSEGRQLAKSIMPASWKMEANGWNLANYYQGYQFYTVEIDIKKCSLCQACVSYCSQKVFCLKESFLQIENEKCVNCSDCTDICPKDAIQIKLDIKRESEFLEAFHTKDCQDCGQSFHTFVAEIEKCHICVDRDPEWLSPY